MRIILFIIIATIFSSCSLSEEVERIVNPVLTVMADCSGETILLDKIEYVTFDSEFIIATYKDGNIERIPKRCVVIGLLPKNPKPIDTKIFTEIL